nr:hypothetical protein [Tanacetum cinerariifolium]
MLEQDNPLVISFRMAGECFANSEDDYMKLRLIGRRPDDGRQYNLPTAFEVAALIVGDFDTFEHKRDIVLHKHSMALCKPYGLSNLFITFTCNPKRPEITSFLKKRGLKSEDHPDVSTRVFKMNLDHLINDIKENRVFGKVKAEVYTIEFQKRGLPQCQICFWLDDNDKFQNPADIDRCISTEIPDPDEDPELNRLAKEFMMHSPCGPEQRNCPCMVGDKCSRHFPMESLGVHDNDKLKGNNVVGPLVVNMVEHNKSSRKPGHLKKDCKGGKVGNKANGSGTNGLVDGFTNSLKGKKKYFVTFINDASRFRYVYLLHSKDEALNKFKVFKTKVELQEGLLIKRFRTDREVVRLPDPKLKTLDERGIECIFVRYAEHSKAFRFYVIEPNESVSTNLINESNDAIFDENRFSSVPRPSLSISNVTKDIGGSVVPKKVNKEVTKEVVTQQLGPETRKGKRNRTPKNFGPEFQLYLIEGTRNEKKAINDEMDSIMGNNTWVLADLPPGCKPLGCKLIFKRKLKVNLTKKFLSLKFSMKDMGEANVILGIVPPAFPFEANPLLSHIGWSISITFRFSVGLQTSDDLSRSRLGFIEKMGVHG